MKRFLARQAVRLVVGVSGAVAMAAVISAAGEPHPPGLGGFGLAAGSRLLHFAQFDLGHSAISGLPVVQELAVRLPPTLLLVAMGGAVALLAGLPLGLLFALGATRRVAAPFLQLITATPVFCAGLALAWLAAHLLHWPVTINAPRGYLPLPGQEWQVLALPVLTVGLAGAAAVQLALRHAAADSSGGTYRFGLRQLGLSGFDIERLYVMPQVLAGLIANLGDIVLALLSATVVAEWVFHRDGAADLFVRSVALGDWNMAAMILLVFALITFVAEFVGRLAGHLLANEGQA